MSNDIDRQVEAQPGEHRNHQRATAFRKIRMSLVPSPFTPWVFVRSTPAKSGEYTKRKVA